MLSRAQDPPAVQTSRAVTIATGIGSEIVTTGRVPKSLQQGVLKVMLAFPTPGLADADWRIMRDTYLEAIEGYPQAVVEWTLKFLLFNNPRNTPTFSCPPTPQDVREACQATQSCWERCIINYYFEDAWATAYTYGLSKAISDRYHAVRASGKPGAPDCIVSEDLQVEYLRREIDRQLPYVESEHPSRREDLVPTLLLISDEMLDRMPEVAFPEGARDMIRQTRAARTEAAFKAAELKAYLNSLPYELLAVRRLFAYSQSWSDRSEADIRAEADSRLEDIRAARLEAENGGGEFLGLTFPDGSEWREKEFQKSSMR